jgi:competence protein ComEC
VRFRARIAKPIRPDLTVAVLKAVGPPDFGRASAVQRAAQAVRARFAAACRETLPADQAAMLPGLVLGDTAAVSTATTAEFRTAGLTHLTAVSGANVTIVCGAVLLSAGLIGPRPAVLLAALALVVFVVVVQPTASVLRAAVMGAITLLAVVSGRRRQAIPVLAATVLALMVAAPQLAVDLGFALSVSATAALVTLWPSGAELLIRFTGPEVWWLLQVARAASALPGAAVAVPTGWGGMLTVSGASAAVLLLWRWRWFRWTAAGMMLCAAAWSVSGFVSGP